MHTHALSTQTDAHWWVSQTGPDLTSGRWRLMHPLWVTGWGIEGQGASLIKRLTGAIQALWTTATPITHAYSHTHTYTRDHTKTPIKTQTKSLTKTNSHIFLTITTHTLFPPSLSHPLFQLSRLALSTNRLNHALPEIKLIPQSQAAGTKNKKINRALGRAAQTY